MRQRGIMQQKLCICPSKHILWLKLQHSHFPKNIILEKRKLFLIAGSSHPLPILVRRHTSIFILYGILLFLHLIIVSLQLRPAVHKYPAELRIKVAAQRFLYNLKCLIIAVFILIAAFAD